MTILNMLPILVMASLLSGYLVSRISPSPATSAFISFFVSVLLGILFGITALYAYEWLYPLSSISKESKEVAKHYIVNKQITSAVAVLASPLVVYSVYAIKKFRG